MSTITQEITRLQTAKANLKTSIEAKGVTVSADTTLDQYPALVDSIPSGGGGGSDEYNDVLFFDYDGTITNQYTKDEFLALSELPSNPDHTSEGLTSQGWNYNLEDAQAYVRNYGKLDIGQLYITSDGKTKFVVDIPYDNFTFKLKIDNSGTTTFDWGDGTIDSQSANNASHIYLIKGIYTILVGDGINQLSINGWNASNICFNDKIISSCIIKIFLGNANTTIGGLYNLYNLKIITLFKNSFLQPTYSSYGISGKLSHINCDTVSLSTNLDTSSILFSKNLKSISIRNVNSNKIGSFQFYDCKLNRITVPETVTELSDSVFYKCYYLSNIIIPKVANIGYSVFNECYNLFNIIMSFSSTSIQYSIFNKCIKLEKFIIPPTVTSIGNNAFSYCNIFDITIPPAVTSIATSAFSDCLNLSNITFNEGLTTIGNTAFVRCNLNVITIPSTVTSIGTNAFAQNDCLSMITCLALIPPTLASNSIPSWIHKIYVPAESVEAYKAATNWSNYADKIFPIPTE